MPLETTVTVLDVTVTNDGRIDAHSTETQQVSSPARKHPAAPAEPLVHVLDTRNPPAGPLFDIPANTAAAAKQIGFDLFELLVVEDANGSGVAVEDYRNALRFWINHYTTIRVDRFDDLMAGVPHEVRESRYRPGDPEQWYRNIRLRTHPLVLYIGPTRGAPP